MFVADTFALDLKAFAEKAGENARTVSRKVSLEVLTSVVMKTPVGNPSLWKSAPPPGYVGGRLRANWHVSVGVMNHATTDRIDKQGQATIERGNATIQSADVERGVYIMNSLPYVREIEYQGHSKQAPAGMVRVTVAQWNDFIAKAVAELPK